MKRVIIGLGVIAVVAAIVVGVTRAYFADVETSKGNIFQVGKLNLKVDNHCYYNGAECICAQSGEHAGECYWDIGGNGQFGDGEISEGNRCFCTWSEKDLSDSDLFFDFADVKPGDFGEDTISLHVVNNDAWLCAQLENLTNDDNGCEDPENKTDTTCGAGEGELADNLFFTVWQDDDCDNVLDTGEEVLVDSQPASEDFWPLADSTTGEPVAGDSTVCYGIKWEVPLSTTNIIQSDSLSGDITFTAVQARHMDSFQCSDLTNGGGGMECIHDYDCDDGNVCTADVCSDGVCQHNCQIGVACDDGNTDTVMDKCQLVDGECQCSGTLAECTINADCDDNNICTVDICENYQCAHHSQTGMPCDDGDPNTHNDTCQADGQCTGCVNYYYDQDNDGYGVDDDSKCLNSPLMYYRTTEDGDCNDSNPFIHPGIPESCDGIDNNCDGNIDENLPTHTYYQDSDGDGYGNPNSSIDTCGSQPNGYVVNGLDCNDSDVNIHPGIPESCDGIDNNCDGNIDENLPTHTYYQDSDGDGYGDNNNTLKTCSTDIPNGYSIYDADCNDSNPDINPDAIEICDNIDNDCDGVVDGFYMGGTCWLPSNGGLIGEWYCCNGSSHCGPCE